MRKIKLGLKKPEKKIELKNGEYLVAEHKGDINYLRFVKFKQLAPQFWERMDSPLFEVYLQKIQDAFDQGKYMKGHSFLLDYKMAISQAQKSHDAIGLCFALITYEEGEGIEFVPTDVDLKEKLNRMVEGGLGPDVIHECVVNFMQASLETFQDHLTLLEVQKMMTEIES
jgi:hypothetical protein